MRLCCHPTNEKRVHESNRFKGIDLTRDNVMKIALLHLRIKAGIPIIIMGETGVGKTVLVELLNLLIDGRVKTLSLHAGNKEREIKQFVKHHVAVALLLRLADQVASIRQQKPFR